MYILSAAGLGGGCPSIATTSVGAVIQGRLPAARAHVHSGPVVRADKRRGLRKNVNEAGAQAREWDGYSALGSGDG